MILGGFKYFDSMIFGKVLPNQTELDLKKIRAAADDAGREMAHRDFVFTLMDALDSKTAALLTHISLIIAALTFLYTSYGQSGWAKWMILGELCPYLLLTIFCLRAIRMTSGLTGTEMQETRALEVELFRRRAVYNFAANATIYVTVLMVLTLIATALFGAQRGQAS